MKRLVLVLIILSAAFYGLVAQASPDAGPTTPGTYNFSEEGYASWYGQEFAGRKTSNGEIYDPSLMTAAHPSLPFGTLATVTNLANGKQVQVRINDRGPFKAGRSIDLSQAAAASIDLVGSGLAKVHIEAISVSSVAEPTTDRKMTIQIISFSVPQSAAIFNANLLELGFDSRVEPSPSGYYRVVIPSVAANTLAALLDKLKTAGFPDVLVRKE
jgi:rare lipoprotein A